MYTLHIVVHFCGSVVTSQTYLVVLTTTSLILQAQLMTFWNQCQHYSVSEYLHRAIS